MPYRGLSLKDKAKLITLSLMSGTVDSSERTTSHSISHLCPQNARHANLFIELHQTQNKVRVCLVLNMHFFLFQVGISDPFGNLTLMSWLMSVDSVTQKNLSVCLCSNRSKPGSCSLNLLKIFKTVHFGSDTSSFCTRVSKLGFPELCMDDENDYDWLRSRCPESIGDSFSNVSVTGSIGRLPCFELHAEYNSFLDSSKYWLEGVGICVVGVFGLCGNALTIIVLRKSETNRPFNRLLMCLAIADSLLIFVSIGETAIVGTFMTTHPTWYKLCYPYLVHPLKGIVQTATIFMIVAVSAERYKAVCHPLR